MSLCIIDQARTWLGTPFHHQARVKGKGCDCLGLVIGVARELELKNKHGQLIALCDEVTYSRAPSGTYLLSKLEGMFDEVPVSEAAPGDLALFTVAGNPQHLAILALNDGNSMSGGNVSEGNMNRINVSKDNVSESNVNESGERSIAELSLIHCDARSRRVVEHRLDEEWRSRLVRVFRWQR